MQTKMMLRYCENTLRFSRVGAKKSHPHGRALWQNIVVWSGFDYSRGQAFNTW